jgi:hypothetical protein
MASFRKKLKSFLLQVKVFSSISDVRLYRKIVNGHIKAKAVPINIREAGGNPLLVRPGTTDHLVLWDKFHH